MGLSMEERRILWEIEQELTRAEPGLAVRLSTLGRARRRGVLYSRRARVTWAFAVLAIVFMLTYTLLMLRSSPRPVISHRTVSTGHSIATGHSARMTAAPPSRAKSLSVTQLNSTDAGH